MSKQTTYRFFQRATLLSASALVLGTLGACGNGPIDTKSYDATAAAGSTDEISAESTQQDQTQYLQLSQEQLTAAAAAAEAERQRLAQQDMTATALSQALALQEGPTVNPGRKMLVVGLDTTSLAADNGDWLSSSRFASTTDEQKATMRQAYVSLSGKDLVSYYSQSCPVIDESNDLEMYRCLAGLYYGKNADGKMCFTSIEWNGHIRHINDATILSSFNPGEAHGAATPVPNHFTHAHMGGNSFILFNGTRTSDTGYQRVLFRFDSANNSLRIEQTNTDPAWGTGVLEGDKSTCIINMG